MANLSFDATSVAPSEAFSILPSGKYPAQIVQSEMRPTKDGNGQYLWLELDLIDGEFKGRKIWDRLNLSNSNAQAVEIAQRTLSAICHAVGELHVSDSEQLHFKPVLVTVRVRPAREGYDASNEIRGYEPLPGAQSAQPQTRPTVVPLAPVAKPTAATTPPWRQKKAD